MSSEREVVLANRFACVVRVHVEFCRAVADPLHLHSVQRHGDWLPDQLPKRFGNALLDGVDGVIFEKVSRHE